MSETNETRSPETATSQSYAHHFEVLLIGREVTSSDIRQAIAIGLDELFPESRFGNRWKLRILIRVMPTLLEGKKQ